MVLSIVSLLFAGPGSASFETEIGDGEGFGHRDLCYFSCNPTGPVMPPAWSASPCFEGTCQAIGTLPECNAGNLYATHPGDCR